MDQQGLTDFLDLLDLLEILWSHRAMTGPGVTEFRGLSMAKDFFKFNFKIF